MSLLCPLQIYGSDRENRTQTEDPPALLAAKLPHPLLHDAAVAVSVLSRIRTTFRLSYIKGPSCIKN